MNKKVVVIGGGTISHVRSHLALCAPAFGNTAKRLADICRNRFEHMDVELVLTKMADPTSKIETNEDLSQFVDQLINDNTTKVIFFTAAVVDFDGTVVDTTSVVKSGKYAQRLETSSGRQLLDLSPADKIIQKIRSLRKDIFLVGFKTTCDSTAQEQFSKGLNLLKKASCNLVLANDVVTRNNIIITPEEGVYAGEGWSRDAALKELVDIAWKRTHLSFTRSTVVSGSPIPWETVECANPTLVAVVEYCIRNNAYKPFNGATTGHFAMKLEERTFVTSIRKTDFNKIKEVGMVKVTTDGDDNVISYGAKPSVGGQSQRIIFDMYKDCDSIVHFHCPLKEDHLDNIKVVSQREYECGSHECGQNTANGLTRFTRDGHDIYCVMLDRHGPNIVFHHSIKPETVIQFIKDNFDLSKSTSGFEKVDLKLV